MDNTNESLLVGVPEWLVEIGNTHGEIITWLRYYYMRLMLQEYPAEQRDDSEVIQRTYIAASLRALSQLLYLEDQTDTAIVVLAKELKQYGMNLMEFETIGEMMEYAYDRMIEEWRKKHPGRPYREAGGNIKTYGRLAVLAEQMESMGISPVAIPGNIYKAREILPVLQNAIQQEDKESIINILEDIANPKLTAEDVKDKYYERKEIETAIAREYIVGSGTILAIGPIDDPALMKAITSRLRGLIKNVGVREWGTDMLSLLKREK